jgi:hypothetical protein
MIQVIDFYELDEANPEKGILLGSVTLNDRGEYRVVGGFPAIMKDELNDVLKNGILSYDKSRQLLPRDGKDFVERLLGRYSGSRVWAHLRKEGEEAI